MDRKLEKLLNHIGINEDNMQYFNNSYVNKVEIDKNNNTLNFIITMDNIPNISVYNDVLNCLNHEFSSKTRLEFDCKKESYENIKEYFEQIIDNYAKDSARYNVFRNRNIEVNNNEIIFKVFNKIEEINIKNIENDNIKKLNNYGLKNIK